MTRSEFHGHHATAEEGWTPERAGMFKMSEPSAAVVKFMEQTDAFRQTLKEKQVYDKYEFGPESEWAYLNRFIIATNGNVQDAVEQTMEHQEWFKELDLGTIYLWPGRRVLNDKCDPLEIDANYPLYIRGTDRYGHPVVYAKVGGIQVKNILKLVEADEFVRYHAWLRERMMRMRDIVGKSKAQEKQNYNPSHGQYTVVIDFNGGSLSQVGPTFYSLMQQTMAKIDQRYYPERMFRSIFVHTPFIFTAVWRIVRGFLDDDTVAKLRIIRSGFFKHLVEVIDPDNIPEEYGGNAPPLSEQDHISQVTERFYQRLRHQKEKEQQEKEKEREREMERVREKEREKETQQLLLTMKQQQELPEIQEEELEEDDEEAEIEEPVLSPEKSEYCSSVYDLQVALLRAHLDFELMERETLEENDYLRRSIDILRETYPPKTKTREDKPVMDPQIKALDQKVSTLLHELEEILEETSAHQRAISFARCYIEEEAIANERDPKLQALREEASSLRQENGKLAHVLEQSFGNGSSNVFFK